MPFKTGGLGHEYESVSSVAIRALNKHKGMPPPGCTLPPQKYSPLSKVDRLRCLRNAANVLFELAP